MLGRRRWQILGLIIMSLIGVAFGIWLLRAGFPLLGGGFIGIFLWRGQQFVVWLVVPAKAPADVTPSLSSPSERILLSAVCLLAAAVCALGIYLCVLFPQEWQAGLVFVLFGLVVLLPVTIWEVQKRRRQVNSP
ncbi:MAG TPA: hypothetical protein VFR84_13520 [Candidatus Angelobacter sp.]|nr:hypothetical protein [Candidatus Angelobacter sp.]